MATKNGKLLRRYFNTKIPFNGIKDAKADQLMGEELHKLWDRAMKKCGLNQEYCVANPVMILGFPHSSAGRTELVTKKGRDRLIRWTPMSVIIVNFTRDQLVTYQCDYDFIGGRPLSEKAREFHYAHIVSMDTESETRSERKKRVFRKDKIEHYNVSEKFTLTSSAGTKVEISLKEQAVIDELGGGSIDSLVSERAIQAVRTMVRERQVRFR